MRLFTSLIGNTTKSFIRKYKRLFLALIFLLLFLISLNYFVEKFTGKIVGPLIKELVIEKSNGMYRAGFSKMGIVLNSRLFYVENFILSVDSVTYRAKQARPDPGNIFVSAKVPKLYIRVASLLDVYLKRRLRIIGIESYHPQINILKLWKDTATVKKKIRLDDPYKLISDYLRVFEINDFTLTEGSFNFHAPKAADYENYEIKNISVKVINFLLDKNAAQNKYKFFYTDNVEVEIKDQTLFLPDSLHVITFDRLFISTISRKLEIDNFKLVERPRMAGSPVIKTRLNRMYFIIPTLKLTGINFIKAYNRQALDVGQIFADRPMIKFVSSGVVKKDSTANKGNGFLNNVIRDLKIDTLYINDGNIDITLKNDETSSHFSIGNISLRVNEIMMDSIGNPGHMTRINYKDIDIKLDDGRFQFPGHLKNVAFESITARSNPANIELLGLNYSSLKPSTNNHFVTSLDEKRDIALKISFPKIQIKRFDIVALLNHDMLILSEIRMDSSDVFICQNGAVKKKKSKPFDLVKLAEPYSLIKTSLRAVYLDDLYLNKGSVRIGNCKNKSGELLHLADLNIHISRIRVDSGKVSENTLLGADNWFIGCGTVKYQLSGQNRELLAKGVEFESTPGVFHASELILYSKAKASGLKPEKFTRDAEISHIKLNGIDVQNFLKTGMVSIDTFSIASLNLDLKTEKTGRENEKKKNETSTAGSLLKKIELNKFLILSGKANIRQQGETLFYADSLFLGLDKISYSPGAGGLQNLTMGKMDIDLDRYSIHLKKISHQLTGDRINLSSENQSALLTNLKLRPVSGDAGMNIYNMDIPAIRITGFDMARILFDSTLNCSDILISEPVIDLTFRQGKKQKVSDVEKVRKKKPLPYPMKIIRAGQIKLVNGSAKLKKNRNDTSQIIEVKNINLTLKDLDLDSSGIVSKQKLLYSRDIDLLADYITFYQPEKKQFMNLNHLNFSTTDQLLEGSGFYFSNNTGKATKSRSKLKVDLDGIKITHLDLLSILNDHYIDLDEITLKQPYLVYEQVKKEKGHARKKQSKEFTYPFDSVALRLIQIHSLNLVNGKIDMITNNPKDTLSKNNRLYVRGIGLSVEKLLLVPKKHYTLSTSSFISSFNLNIDKMLYDLPDNLNRIEIGQITLNSSDTTLMISDFELKPKVGKYEYGPAKGFQTDWIHLTNKKLTVRNIHLNQLLFENKLITPAITVDSLKIFVFRDKRVPFVETYKPLPPAQLRKMKTVIKIDTVKVKNGNVVYQEFAEKSKAPGEIYITNMNGTLLNITNDSATLAKQPRLFLGADAGFAGKGLINLQVVFDLPDTNDVFHMGLILADLDLRELNRMLAPTAFVKVKSGYDKNLIMTTKSNNDFAYGEMRFYYNDLKIAVLNKKTETPKGIGNALMSFFANSFFINSNNPKLLRLRKGEVFFERNKYKSIFNYWVKTFLSGVVTSIGAKSNKKQIEKIQEAQLKKYETITTPN